MGSYRLRRVGAVDAVLWPVWMTKIITDPFNDFMLYRKAPLALLRGELVDPGLDILERQELEGVHA